MLKIIPMAIVAFCAFAAPAFAQDEAPPGMGDLMDRAERFMKRVEELVQPLIEKLQETLSQVMSEFQEWMGEMNPGELFGEFDGEQWMEQLRRMLENMPGFGGEEEDEDEDFLKVRAIEC
jgi:hypothetical protein